MKHFTFSRTVLASLIIMLATFITAPSFAALNAYLKLKSLSGGKTYTCKLDESGKFSFENVEPGKYDLVFVLDGSRSSDDGTIQSIEINSFSWGASNALGKQGKSTPVTRSNISNNRTGSVEPSGKQGTGSPVTRSNISNNRTATVDAKGPEVTCNGKVVATGDLDGDGVPDELSSSVIWSPKSNIRSTSASDIILHEIVVTNSTTAEGKVKASWNLKENVK
jgi:hypothetical protein